MTTKFRSNNIRPLFMITLLSKKRKKSVSILENPLSPNRLKNYLKVFDECNKVLKDATTPLLTVAGQRRCYVELLMMVMMMHLTFFHRNSWNKCTDVVVMWCVLRAHQLNRTYKQRFSTKSGHIRCEGVLKFVLCWCVYVCVYMYLAGVYIILCICVSYTHTKRAAFGCWAYSLNG